MPDATTAVDLKDQTSYSGSKPVQVLAWKDKTQDWFISNLKYYRSQSRFNYSRSIVNERDMSLLYKVYNNEFPADWFKHITDPLSAKDVKHKAFPAKIRPVNFLRTNIDLLLGEFPRRPYVYNVENLGDTGYSRYMDGMMQTAQSHLTQQFVQEALKQAQAQGQKLTPEQLQQLQQDPGLPEDVKADYQASYRDAIAAKAQKWLTRTVREQEIKKKHHRMFKDWMIAGEGYSYKSVRNDKIVYERMSPLFIDFCGSEEDIFVEDGEWVVARRLLTLSAVVDMFYDTLKEQHIKDLEQKAWASPTAFYSHMEGMWSGQHLLPVDHVQWKGKKQIGFLSYLDPKTFQMVEETVDENYIPDKSKGETVEWRWVNEVYEGWIIGEGGQEIYTEMQACLIQMNEQNNISKCKLSYNGRRYSDTHSRNISAMELGIPFQIMFIIVNYIIEKTIAKSKGKILLFDHNTIPDDMGEEKFFYYAESMGYMTIDRNQIGVDKTWNQYQVVDMTMFESIKQLIDIQTNLKQQWDDILGISRQRKGETMASDGQGINERSVYQSTVITDMIFTTFEELMERDLSGIMELGRFVTAKGVKTAYMGDDYTMQLLEILPEDISLEDLGVFFDRASEHLDRLARMESYAQAMIQNGHKASTVLEVISAANVSELKAKLKQIEAIDAELEQQQIQTEHDNEAAADQRKMKYAEFENMLSIRATNAEFDRKEELAELVETIKGEYVAYAAGQGKGSETATDPATLAKLTQDGAKMKEEFKQRSADRELKSKALDQNIKESKHNMNMDHENLKVAKEKNSIARKKAAVRPKKGN